MPESSSIRRRLAAAPGWVFSAYCIAAAFGTYFCMYGFRKPFTAGTFDEFPEGSWIGALGFKTVLVASQVSGYTLSKFLGIKFVSELPAHYRAIAIVGLIAVAEAALALFAVIPPPWNAAMLFLNGLPLGMVFGLVLGYLEGRRLTEALAAGLCASFIVSSGVVKSVGRWMIETQSVSEYWMPFLTGLLFVVPLLVCVWLLRQIPPPSAADESLRSRRQPMDGAARWALFRRHAVGLSGMLAIYVLLTVMRSIRDDFAVEIWRDLGEEGKPAVFAQSETLVMFGVVLANGAAILIRSNRGALLTSLVLVTAGFAMILATFAGFRAGWLDPFTFMVLTGLGMYIPYVAFHTTIFERFIAAFREPGTIGYLMYLADAAGYLGYVGVMVARPALAGTRSFLDLFVFSSLVIAGVAAVVSIGLTCYYYRRVPADSEGAQQGDERA